MENVGAPVAQPKQGFPVKLALGACCGCLLLVILGFALFGGAIYMGVSKLTAPAEAEVRTFLTKMSENDPRAAYETFSTGMKKAKSVEWLEGVLAAQPDLFAVAPEGPSYSNRSFKNGVVFLRGSYRSKGGKTYYCKFTVVPEGGERWKIEQLDIQPTDFPPEKSE